MDITVNLRRPESKSKSNQTKAANETGMTQEWWIIDQTSGRISKDKKKEGLEFYVFSDQVSPPSVGFLAGYGYVKQRKNTLIHLKNIACRTSKVT